MAKILKISAKTGGILLEWLCIFIIFLAFAIRTSPVQTYIAQQLTSYLSDELGTELSIEKVDIIFLDRVELKGVFARDLYGDTLIYAGSIYAQLYDYNLQKRYFQIEEVEIDRARIGISVDTNGVYNYKFIQEYFAKDKKKKKKPVTILFERVEVKNTRFSWNDNRKPVKEYGMDYFHILSWDIHTVVENFKIDGMHFTGSIKTLQCHEKSGFSLNDLYTGVEVDSSGIYLSDVWIKSPGSWVKAKKFNMLSTGFVDFKSFVDSVSFDGRVDRSRIDLKEGALFAPILKGMNDTIYLSSSLEKKVKNLRLADFGLRIKKKTRITGTFNLPDYRAFEQGFFQEKIDRAYIDVDELKTIRMPDASPERYLSINERVERLGYFDVRNARLDGLYSQFVVAAKKIRTRLGSLQMANGIMFTEHPEHASYLFEHSGASGADVSVQNFQLGTFINDPDIGIIDGLFFLSGEAYSVSDIRFHSLEGEIKQFDYLSYPYQNITVTEGTLEHNVFQGQIDVRDEHLDLTFNGMVDFRSDIHLLFDVDVRKADLQELNITSDQKKISAKFSFDLRGKTANDFAGSLQMDSLHFIQQKKDIFVPHVLVNIERGTNYDQFTLRSNMANGTIKGKLNSNTLINDLNRQIERSMSALFETEIPEKNQKVGINHFDFDLTIERADDFMFIAYPNLKVADGTFVNGHFYEDENTLEANVLTDYFVYDDMRFENAHFTNQLYGDSLVSNLIVDKAIVGDSTFFPQVTLNTSGKSNNLLSTLSWSPSSSRSSEILWHTEVLGLDHFNFVLEKSHFFLRDNRWDIAHKADLKIHEDTIWIENFDLNRGKQMVNLDGIVSPNDDHKLYFTIREFELEEISDMISDVPLSGLLNATGHISNPFHNFQYEGEASILQFTTKNQLVGDINMSSNWVKATQSLALQGDLNYKGNQTFDFIGDYFPRREKNNLDFNLFFEYTDIQFTNAFMNPEVLSEIHGLLNGTLKVTGTPDRPILDGTVHLLGGSAKVDLLGAHFGIEGAISADEDGFYIDGIPVFDEDGNAGLLIGSIYHDNFKDFNFDLLFDLEDDALNKDPLQPWLVQPLDKFLILKSEYKPGELYYGTGYARGVIDVFGYTDNLEVTVDLETRRGTKINIPMYGRGDIEEDEFIIFVDRDTLLNLDEPKIDFTGVDLDLNFKITKDAEVKIIFNEMLEDEITARGHGDMNIALNNIGDVTMNGTFIVSDGLYDFAMGPVKEKFYIREGGSISWTGDPYDALLNMRTYYRVNANIAAATNDQFGTSSGAHQEILCYLDLTESMNKPTIGFDLEAPNANDEANAVIRRIKSDPDELSRQFFSLVLWKRFQPMSGSAIAGGNAAIDLALNQLNAILSKVSDDYTLNVNMDSDHLTGDNTYEFGVSKGFLDDRLILSGSFGVENRKTDESSNQNSVIGDVNLEYLLNKNGTFRVNIFNTSNDKTVIQTNQQGAYTQGAGLYYKEDFNSVKDFKVIQYFLDIFRRNGNKRYPIKRKRKQTPVPQIIPNKEALTPEESTPAS